MAREDIKTGVETARSLLDFIYRHYFEPPSSAI
jgi:hypothetical protein